MSVGATTTALRWSPGSPNFNANSSMNGTPKRMAKLALLPIPLEHKPLHGSKESYERVQRAGPATSGSRTSQEPVFELLEGGGGPWILQIARRLPRSTCSWIWRAILLRDRSGQEYLFGFGRSGSRATIALRKAVEFNPRRREARVRMADGRNHEAMGRGSHHAHLPFWRLRGNPLQIAGGQTCDPGGRTRPHAPRRCTGRPAHSSSNKRCGPASRNTRSRNWKSFTGSSEPSHGTCRSRRCATSSTGWSSNGAANCARGIKQRWRDTTRTTAAPQRRCAIGSKHNDARWSKQGHQFQGRRQRTVHRPRTGNTSAGALLKSWLN